MQVLLTANIAVSGQLGRHFYFSYFFKISFEHSHMFCVHTESSSEKGWYSVEAARSWCFCEMLWKIKRADLELFIKNKNLIKKKKKAYFSPKLKLSIWHLLCTWHLCIFKNSLNETNKSSASNFFLNTPIRILPTTLFTGRCQWAACPWI